MLKVLLFAEDTALERYTRTLISRIGDRVGTSLSIRIWSYGGGFGAVLRSLSQFRGEISDNNEQLPDILAVAVDGNCKGWRERQAVVREKVSSLNIPVCCAVADPHVERWMLLDGAAFRTVLGKGCQAPDYKCAKDRYKGLLAKAVTDAGVPPLLGGVEYAEDLAAEIDLDRVTDPSLRSFIDEISTALRNAKNVDIT